MLYSGLVSVTFRQLKPERIIELVKEAGFDSIEWGGDIHVPHGDIEAAKYVGRKTEAAGLKIASYGSYYRVGTYEKPEEEFKKVLDSAEALKAPIIRVWAGNLGSASADETFRTNIIEESRKIADMAEKNGIEIAYEYHGNTLTDNLNSAFSLISSVNHKNVKSYWQPDWNISEEDRIEGLRTMLPNINNIHAFYWGNKVRYSLEEGAEHWEKYINIIGESQRNHCIMLEFVKEDSEEQFLRDAAVLKRLLKG